MRNRHWTGPNLPLLFLAAALATALANVAGAIEARVIYRCKADGVTTLSDRPCAPGAEAYLPDDSRISSYEPSETAEQSKPPAPGARKKIRQKPAADTAAKRIAACERVNSSLRDIARKMRSGYNVREGERLRERKAKLEKQRRANHC